jgi:GNAT superfamily N-acetyltransferase
MPNALRPHAQKTKVNAMNSTVTYRFMEEREAASVSDLVARVFMEYIAPLYAPGGVREFFRYIDPDALRERCQKNHFSLIALHEETIVGIIMIRDSGHVSLLFVDKSFQGQGIGRELLNRAISVCRSKKPELNKLTVNSSPNSVAAYRKFNFQETASEQVIKGIRSIPMVFDLPREERP